MPVRPLGDHQAGERAQPTHVRDRARQDTAGRAGGRDGEGTASVEPEVTRARAAVDDGEVPRRDGDLTDRDLGDGG